MLMKREVHRDMADLNAYTAKRLREMARSMEALAKTFGRDREEPGLTREDGVAALEAATAMVCGDCANCGIQIQCYPGEAEDNYYLYYLLRTFEKKGSVEYEDMPRRFLEVCRRKSDYLGHLNRNLGRATMNLAWKNRFLESRDTVMVQFEEMAGILDEFSGQMERAADVTAQWEAELKAAFRKRRVALEQLLVLQYEEQQREVFFTARTTNGRCMTSRDAAEFVGRVLKGTWTPARDSKTIITRNASAFRFIEDGKYRILFGASRVPRGGEEISGDNYSLKHGLPGQAILSLSDGMGSGRLANADSEKVIEMTEQLLEAGFSPRAALKMVNTVLLLTGRYERPATLDLCLVDLYTGIVDAMKLGAVASFVITGQSVDTLEADHVPAGVLSPVEPLMLSKKLWDGDRIVLVSDGVLEAMPGDDKEEAFRDFLAGMPEAGPQETAEMVMTYALSLDAEPQDDMTVLVGGIYGR